MQTKRTIDKNKNARIIKCGDKMKKYKLYLLDMDGTIYLGNRLFPQTPAFLQYIKDIGGRYMFLTNNSSKSASVYVEKLKNMGIAATKDDFLTSAYATFIYLKETYGNKKLYVLGTQSLYDEFSEWGLNVTTAVEDDVEALVIGYDTELTYQKLEDACVLLGRGVDYIATHPDMLCPTEYGFAPDCGCFCEMLHHATGRKPKVIGKPYPEMVLMALKQTGVDKSEAIFLGDRMYTDIACALNAGIDAGLVLTGETTLDMASKSEIKPTYILDSISDCII